MDFIATPTHASPVARKNTAVHGRIPFGDTAVGGRITLLSQSGASDVSRRLEDMMDTLVCTETAWGPDWFDKFADVISFGDIDKSAVDCIVLKFATDELVTSKLLLNTGDVVERTADEWGIVRVKELLGLSSIAIGLSITISPNNSFVVVDYRLGIDGANRLGDVLSLISHAEWFDKDESVSEATND